MTGRLIPALGRFRREEKGQMMIEFALVIPLIVGDAPPVEIATSLCVSRLFFSVSR